MENRTDSQNVAKLVDDAVLEARRLVLPLPQKSAVDLDRALVWQTRCLPRRRQALEACSWLYPQSRLHPSGQLGKLDEHSQET